MSALTIEKPLYYYGKTLSDSPGPQRLLEGKMSPFTWLYLDHDTYMRKPDREMLLFESRQNLKKQHPRVESIIIIS